MTVRLNKYIIRIAFLIAGLPSLAQCEVYYAVAGTVIDQEMNMPLENASIGISNQSMGTISNAYGQFLLKIPAKFKNDSLVVTYLGYARYAHVITEVMDNENLVISLIPASVRLGVVIIQENALNAEDIIAKAIERIKDNYPTNPFVIEGFFRDILKEDDYYVALTEAAIRVFDKNFQRRLNHGITEDVQIIEARNSLNYADPLIRRVRKQNEIVDLLDNNSVHYQRGLLNTEFFDYEVDSVFQTENDLVFVISTIPGGHKIYVTDANYAIIKTTEQVHENNGTQHPEFPLNDSLIVRRMVYFNATSEFQHYNGKMYLKYLNETDAYEILNKRTRQREFLVESYKEFVVTNILDSNVVPISKKESYNFRDAIVSKDYNPVFWSNFSTVQLSPLNPGVKRSLEREQPLNAQFSKKE